MVNFMGNDDPDSAIQDVYEIVCWMSSSGEVKGNQMEKVMENLEDIENLHHVKFQPILRPTSNLTGRPLDNPRKFPLVVISDSTLCCGKWLAYSREESWKKLFLPYLQDLDFDSVRFFVTSGEYAAGYIDKINLVTNNDPRNFEGFIVLISMCNDLFNARFELSPSPPQ